MAEQNSLGKGVGSVTKFSLCRRRNRPYMSSRTVILTGVMQQKSHLKVASDGMSIEMLERFMKGNKNVQYIFGSKPPIIG